MILIDLHQVMIATLMVQLGKHQNAQVEESMLRHMILNSIRYNRKKFGDEFGELVICSDAKNSWRRNIFPYYKALRRKGREESELDWQHIFEALGNIKRELKEVFPYPMIEVDGAEADDVIATLVFKYGKQLDTGNSEKIMILSGDKDYIQLHKYVNVRQYDPTRKVWITHDDPVEYLREHVLRGDRGDGVPNVLSSDNALVLGTRQLPVTKKRLALWRDIDAMDEDVRRNYERNKKMIDLTQIPEDVSEDILTEFEKQQGKPRKGLFSYFYRNGLSQLIKDIGDF